MMNACIEKYIENNIRPKIQGDGGEIIFNSVNNDTVVVTMKGECSKCLILDRCISWIEERIECDLNKKVKIIANRSKPFFWDT